MVIRTISRIRTTHIRATTRTTNTMNRKRTGRNIPETFRSGMETTIPVFIPVTTSMAEINIRVGSSNIGSRVVDRTRMLDPIETLTIAGTFRLGGETTFLITDITLTD